MGTGIRRLVLLGLLAALLAGCGGPNLKTVNLEPALVQDGDLPPGMVAGQVTDGSMSGGAAASDFVNRIERDFTPVGHVLVILYDDDAPLQRDFKGILPGLTADGAPSTEVGTQAVTDYRGLGHVLFVRCHALVHVMLSASELATLNYAKRLDKRLEPLVC
jgi:hypothetical protein